MPIPPEPSLRSAGAPPEPRHQSLPPRLVLLLAVGCGASVANLYYAQPLLSTLAHAFGVSTATAGLLITITQIGYVLGLAFLAPLGDLRERRRLICTTLLVTGLGLAAAAAAPGFAIFAAALAIVGITSVVAQVIVPMSASLAGDSERGRVVGTVMSGLLVGILLARTASGLIAAVLGWRAVFIVATVLMFALAGTLRRTLPRVPAADQVGYLRSLASILELIRDEPVLRLRMVLGAVGFGTFSALWTALAFLLSGPPFHYGNAVIGLFGLAGVAGATAASVAGRLADRGHGGRTSTAAIIVLALSWAILAAGRSSAILLIIGIAILDLGTQSLHISNQSAIYALAPEARSRLTTAYMVSCFAGGALLSGLASTLWSSGGWSAVCLVGGATAVGGLLVWIAAGLTARVRRGRPACAEA
jgi:predicted MFS family arabinose efflux permease